MVTTISNSARSGSISIEESEYGNSCTQVREE